MKGFCAEVMEAARYTAEKGIENAAQKGVELMVRQATFSDYTGGLINSYAALIKRHGSNKFGNVRQARGHSNASRAGGIGKHGNIVRDENYNRYNPNLRTKAGTLGYIPGSGAKNDPRFASVNNTFLDENQKLALLTSYKRFGVITIDKVIKNGKVKRRKQRNRKSIEYMRNYGNVSADGYGRMLTKIKGKNTGVKYGYSVMFTNLAPYAERVQSRNQGSRVYPSGKSIITISQHILKQYFKRLNGK